ncbi:ABC transporter ATP-binding protein [Daejeonella oryzae]|uniref:ABC transporter ATP-binding protein n=1 Tax=Daejeonella oryzae TaxID=1122943 RepID=UPI0003FEFD5D|nr:ABC transporter ATP-binding protein [Daejeonella oryzae]
MQIVLEKIGRRFNRDWIFKEISFTFKMNESYAILGANGSGKSTLLQIIAGNLTSSAGTVSYSENDRAIHIENVYSHLSMAAPYMELIEEFTLQEIIDFHFSFKSYRDGMDSKDFLALLALDKAQHKALKYFSSGMKQRVKLALAFCSQTPVLLLDEPTANLDNQGIHWYLSLIEKFSLNRLVIVCSNQEHEYKFCKQTLNVADYK